MANELAKMQEEVTQELSNREVFDSLLKTTFKGLSGPVMKEAIMDGMIRGFTFKDFRERNVYAIPFGQSYSLITSIDYARKIGAKSGIIGVDEPEYGEDATIGVFKGGSWCKITVHKVFGDKETGEFTAKVYFEEFSTGKNLWLSKPRVMIAKVAEMHALRKACPELAQMYTQEEVEKQESGVAGSSASVKKEWNDKIVGAQDMTELLKVWAEMPAELKVDPEIKAAAGAMKGKFMPKAAPVQEKPKDENSNV